MAGIKYCLEFLGNVTGSETELSRLRNDYSFSLAEVVQQINSNLFHLQIDAVHQLRCHISREGSVLIKAVVDAGLLPKLFEILRHNNYDLVFEAISTLKYIAFGADVIGGMIDLDKFNALSNLLSSRRFDIVEQVIWLFGAICTFRSFFQYLDPLKDRIFLISDHSGQGLSLIRAVAWTLLVLSFKYKKSAKDLLNMTLNLLQSPETAPTVSALIKTYKNVPFTHSEIEIVDEAQYEEIPGLIDFIILDDDDTSILALRAITVISLQNYSPSPILIESALLSTLFEFFNHPQMVLQHEVLLCTSAIMCKSPESAVALANCGLLQIINDKLLNSKDEKLQMKCLCTLALFLKTVPHEVNLFLESDVLHSVCNFMKHYSTTDDNEYHTILRILALVLSTAEEFNHLETTVSIIKENGGLDKIKELQTNRALDVIIAAKSLDKTYFSPEMEMPEFVEAFLENFTPTIDCSITNYGVRVY